MTDVSKRRRRPTGGEFAREGGTDASDLAGGMGGTGYETHAVGRRRAGRRSHLTRTA